MASTSNPTVQKIKPLLLNGWDNFGCEYEEATIYKNENGEVRCEGLVKGDYSKTIFVFPEGFRPNKKHIFNLQANDQSHRVDVNEKGRVYFNNEGIIEIEGSGWLSLDGLAFYAKH